MKRKNYLLAALLLALNFGAYCQTVPFGFKNLKSRMFKDLPAPDPNAIGPGYQKQLTDYSNIAINLKATADLEREGANQKFSDEVAKLSIPKNSAEIRAYNVAIENLENERKLALKDADYLDKESKAYNYRHRISTNSVSWFPVRNPVDAEMYYNGYVRESKAKFLSNTLLSFSSDGGRASIFNEIYVDYFGPVRVGLGAMISNKQRVENQETIENKEEKSKDAMQRLLGGGGNGVLSASYPLFNVDDGKGFAIKLGVAPKLAVDIPKIGTENSDYGLNYNIGAEGSIFYSGENDVITFFGNFRFAKIGGNNIFFNNLEKIDKKAFGFNQISFGLAFTSTFRLSYNHYFGSDFVNKNFPGTISFTIIPN